MASLLGVAAGAVTSDRGSAAPIPEAARAAAAAALGAFGSTFFLLKESGGKDSNSDVDDIFQLAFDKLPQNEASRLAAAAAAAKPAAKIRTIVKGSSGSSFRLSGIINRRYSIMRRGSSSGASRDDSSSSSSKSSIAIGSARKSHDGGVKGSLRSAVSLLLQQPGESVRACGVRTAERLVMGYHAAEAESSTQARRSLNEKIR